MNRLYPLIAARAKIATPETWTQHALARDINDNDKPASHSQANNIHWGGIDGRDPFACKFCALGAVQAVTDDNGFDAVRLALNRAARELFGMYSIAEINDDYGHEDVLQCFDRAIAA